MCLHSLDSATFSALSFEGYGGPVVAARRDPSSQQSAEAGAAGAPEGHRDTATGPVEEKCMYIIVEHFEQICRRPVCYFFVLLDRL